MKAGTGKKADKVTAQPAAAAAVEVEQQEAVEITSVKDVPAAAPKAFMVESGGFKCEAVDCGRFIEFSKIAPGAAEVVSALYREGRLVRVMRNAQGDIVYRLFK